jgi:hypothetical protein
MVDCASCKKVRVCKYTMRALESNEAELGARECEDPIELVSRCSEYSSEDTIRTGGVQSIGSGIRI